MYRSFARVLDGLVYTIPKQDTGGLFGLSHMGSALLRKRDTDGLRLTAYGLRLTGYRRLRLFSVDCGIDAQ